MRTASTNGRAVARLCRIFESSESFESFESFGSYPTLYILRQKGLAVASMRDAVEHRVDQLRGFHAGLKDRKYGFLVRPATLVVGWIVLIVGIITIPLPGQGWLTTFIGVGILSLEQRWAHGLLDWGVHQYDRFTDWFKRQSRPVRWGLIALLVAVIWVVFVGLAYASWRAGQFDFLTGFFEAGGLER